MTNAPARQVVVRWALRLFRREWRQQGLVLALVTLSVAAAVLGSSAAYNMTPSRDAEFGTAEHRIDLDVDDVTVLDAQLSAAEGRFGPLEVIGHREVSVPGSVEAVDVRAQDPQGTYGAPMLALRDGRYPASAGEVAVTDRVAQVFAVGVGDVLSIDGRERTVVGLVENPEALGDEFALVAPAAADVPQSVTVLAGTFDGTGDGPGPSGAFAVQERGTTEKTTAAALALVLATVVLLLVCLVAAAGFAVVAHRRLRQLGMLAAIGATTRHLRLVVLANGAVVGVIAAVAGTALALVGWVAIAPRLEAPAGHRIDRFDVPWWLIVAGMTMAVVTAIAAAWWPARAVARIPITLALSARPPHPKPAHRSALAAGVLLALGFACVTAGINVANDEVNPLLLIGGTAAVVAGILFLSPLAISALAAGAAPLPVAVRLALRDLARHQARSGAALAAISLGLGLAVATVGIASASEHPAGEGNLSDRQILVRVGDGGPVLQVRNESELEALQAQVDRFAATLDEAAVVELDVAVSPTEESGGRPVVILGRRIGEHSFRDVGLLYIESPELLANLGVDPGTIAEDTDVLTSQSGDLELVNVRGPEQPRIQHVDAPGYSSVPSSLLTTAGLARGGWETARAGWLLEAAQPLTDAQVEAALAMAAGVGMTIEAREGQDGLATTRSVATAAGMLLALGVLAMTVGLIRSEAGHDLRTLTAAGATSATRRTLTAATAGGLALLGVLLGIAGAYWTLVAGYLDDLEPLRRVPWLHLTVTLVGLPVVATAAAWLLAGREPLTLARPALD